MKRRLSLCFGSTLLIFGFSLAVAGTAGNTAPDPYSITKGDTLSDISKKVLGNSKHWPKIWAINNKNIKNPHRISPGQTVYFISDQTGAAATKSSESVGVGNSSTPSRTPSPRPTEWKSLPHQRWESFRAQKLVTVDPLGFDNNSKIHIARASGFEPTMIPATEKIPSLGKIVSSRHEGEFMGGRETFYIESEPKLQVGDIYCVTSKPSTIKSSKTSRKGYSYEVLGRVKIIGVRDGLFIGSLLSARETVSRGDYIIARVEKIPELDPIPGPSPLTATLLMDHRLSTSTSAQYKEVLVDRGLEDGLKPGMIFRNYEHFDPTTNKRITDADFIVQADVMITQVSERSSTGLVIRSKGTIEEFGDLNLLTDISELTGKVNLNKGDGDSKGTSELDELDKLDSQDGLGADEAKTLRQLEKWTKNPSPLPSALPTPIGSTTPEPLSSPPPVVPDVEPSPLSNNEPPPMDEPQPSSTEELPPPPAAAE